VSADFSAKLRMDEDFIKIPANERNLAGIILKTEFLRKSLKKWCTHQELNLKPADP
jgi:hypothetical protein